MFPNMPSGDELKKEDIVTFGKPEKLLKPKGVKSARIEADKYFLKIATVVAERSTCRRHHIGAVAVRDKRILATGYNGAPSGLKDCLELGYCLRDKLGIASGERHEVCRAIHAEQNLIIQAGLYGVSLEDATVYCTHTPCLICCRMLVNARIKRFVSYHDYDPSRYTASVNFAGFGDFFKEAGIKVDKIERPSSRITYLD
ncbi:MAG: cytidine/deoxycytidylate deaminase family protein [Chloroflexota bacterium]